MADDVIAARALGLSAADRGKPYYYLIDRATGAQVSESSVAPSADVAAKYDVVQRVGRQDTTSEVWNAQTRAFEPRPVPALSQDAIDADALIALNVKLWSDEDLRRALQLVLTTARRGIR